MMEELDWSEPFDISIFDSHRTFLVRCERSGDADQFADMLCAAGVLTVIEKQSIVRNANLGRDCFRFSERGYLSGALERERYDRHASYAQLPRFTFYRTYICLPELDVSNSTTLL